MSREFAGTLSERIEIERQVEARNAMGLQEHKWERVASCHAAVVAEGVGPEVEGMSLSAMPRFRVTIRRREEIAIDQRVRWRGRLLMVRQLIEDPRMRDRLTLRCEEVRQ
jgi:SPP1 family predicted phage head-tail adaptor